MRKLLLGALLGGVATYGGISYFNQDQSQGLSHKEYQTVNAYIHHHKL